MNIAIIPARGGSKRIPKKNIKPFHGKPIIAYSIEAAIRSQCFDRIIVSTDCSEIADIAVEYGAEVPFLRPPQYATDTSSTMVVIQHAIEWLINQGVSLDYLCCIYPTAPMMSSKDLKTGFELVQTPNVQYAFSAASFAYPIQRAFYLDEACGVHMFQPEFVKARSQELVEAYHDAGQFYWGKVKAFKQSLPFFAPHSQPVIIPRYRVQDIDNPEDWKVAEHLYGILQDDSRNPV